MIDETGCVAHYTRLENVAKILHDKKLRLSKACDFADPRESSMSWISIEGIGDDPDRAEKQCAAENIRYKSRASDSVALHGRTKDARLQNRDENLRTATDVGAVWGRVPRLLCSS